MFRYMLATDGAVFDSFETFRCDWQAGDEMIGDGNTARA
jgi:hypothetical protein